MRIRTIKPEFWSHPVMAQQDDTTKLLALGLLNFADDEGFFYADPKLIRSALRPFDDDSSNVRRSLEKLEKIGYIETRIHPTHGAVGTVLSFDKHQRVDRPKPSEIKDLYDSTNDRRMIDDESSLEGKGSGKGKEQGTRESSVGLFDSFWKAYPKKIGKGEAEKSFKKAIKEVTLEAMIEAVRAQSNSDQWKKDGGQFIPNPSTWLNQKRWNDELELNLSPVIPDGPPDWLPENWKEIAVKMLGEKAEAYTSHTDIPPDWRFSFKQFCTGERQFDEEDAA
jgi:hypothetical protein